MLQKRKGECTTICIILLTLETPIGQNSTRCRNPRIESCVCVWGGGVSSMTTLGRSYWPSFSIADI